MDEGGLMEREEGRDGKGRGKGFEGKDEVRW
jgi:hypothetical protein